MTAKELADRSIRVAQCLINLDIQPGDKIGVCSENRLEFAYLICATLCIGATFAPMNITYSERKLTT